MDVTKLLKTGLKLTNILSFFIWSVASAVPQDGTVVAGSANISQPNSQQTIINQSSQSAVINWSSFNTASTESVLFHQPNSSSIALNKITNGLPTNFNGNLSANGQVWIINPAGVLFGSTSNINVAGLVATTNSINNNNFMAGNYIFDAPSDLSASIINNGNINIADSGIVALVGPNVINNGSIIANLGTVQLSTGGAFVLDLYGDNLINFGSNSPIQNGSVENNNLISATGGKVYMTANAAAGILDNVVSMSGTIQASSAAVNKNGEIILNGGNSGTVRVSGKLIAHKGHIETSGHVLVLDSNVVIDASGGSWLIDPWNITVVSSAGTCTNIGCTQPFTPTGTNSQIGSNLIVNQLNANTDVTLYTGGANGGTDAGSITISAPITANSGSGSLILQADYNVIINQPININGNFSAVAGLTTPSGNIQIGANITTVGTQEYFSPVALTVNPVTLTATGATNSDITFDSTIDGSGGLVVTTPGNIFFFDAIGQGTALSSLATTSGAGVFTVISGNVKTTGAQTYTGDVDLSPNTPPMTLQGSTIEIKNNMVAGLTVDLTINGNLLMDLNSNLGGIGSNVRSLTVTGSSTIGGAINTSTGNETFTGPVTVNGSALFDTNTSGNIIFQSTIEGPGSAAIYSAGSIVFNNTVGLSTALASLTAVANTIDIKNASNTTSFSTTGTQDIQASSGGILLDTLNSITFNAPGQTIDFVGPMDSYSATTPLQTDVVVNGNLFYVEGIHNTPSGVGEKYNLSNYTSVKSFDVTGTSILGASVNSVLQSVNIRTLNNQTYAQSVQLGGTNQNVTSVNGNVTFQGALNGDQFNTQNFTVSAAAGTAEFDGVVGSVAHYLANLSVTANQINITSGATAFTTNGTQTFNGPVTLGTSTVLTSNAGGITFNGTVDGGFDLTTIANSLTIGVVTFNGIVGGTTPLASLTSTVPGNLIGETDVNTTLIHTTGTQTYSGAVIVENPTNPTNVNFSGSTISFNDALLQGSASTTNPVNITISGNFALIGPNGNVQTAGGSTLVNSLHVTGTSIFSNPNASNGVNTLGNQNYDGLVTLNPGGLSSFATVFFATHTSGSAITFGTNTPSVTALQSNGGSPGGAKFILSAGTILNFDGIVGGVGGTNPLSTLTILGSSATTNINTTQINTTGAQSYGSPVVIGDGVAAVLTSTTAGMTFSSTVDALTNGGESLQLISPNAVNLTGNIGSTHPLSALTIGSNSVLTPADIKTAAVSTTTSQTYFGPITMDTIGSLNLTSGTVNFNNTVNSQTTSTALSITGNLSVGSSGSIGLTFSGGSFVHVGSISVSGSTLGPNTNTSGDQTYTGPVTLNTDETFTSTGGVIAFGSAINGDGISGRNLTVNAATSETFSGAIGNLVPLTSLSVSTLTANINTVLVSTTGVQNYNSTGVVLGVPATTAITVLNASEVDIAHFISTKAAPSDLTINGNLVLEAPNGNISTLNPSAYIRNIVINGSTTFSTGIDLPYITAQSNLTFNGPISALGSTSDQSAILNVVSGILTINGTIDGPGGLEIITNTVSTFNINGAIGGTTPLDSFQFSGFGGSPSTANINTAVINTVHDQEYDNLAMKLDQNSVWTSSAGGINLLSVTKVDALTNGGESLQLVSLNPVVLTGNIGSTHPLSSLIIGSNSVLTPADIKTAAISTTASQTYFGPVTMDAIANLNLTSGTVNFNNTVNSQTTSTALTITGNLAVGTSGSIGLTFSGGSFVHVGSLLVTGTTLGPNVTTSGNQIYTGPVTLNTDETMTSTNGNITFGSTIDGGFNLAVNIPVLFSSYTAGPGIVTFNGTVGGTTPLNSLSVNSIVTVFNTPTVFPAPTVHTVGTQTYTGAGTVLPDVVGVAQNNINFQGSTVTFAELLTSKRFGTPVHANVTISGNFVLLPPFGSMEEAIAGGGYYWDFVNSLHVTGTSSINIGVLTYQNQTYDQAVSVVSNVLFLMGGGGVNGTDPGTVTFNSTLDSSGGLYDITIYGESFNDTLPTTTPNNVIFNGIVGGNSTSPTVNTLSVLTADLPGDVPNTTINTTGINTVGTQNYAGPVVIGNSVNAVLTSTTSGMTFGSTVDALTTGGEGLQLVSPLAVTLSGNIGSIHKLSSLIIGSGLVATPATINTPSILTTNGQRYYGPVTLDQSALLLSTAGVIEIDQGVSGPGFNLSIDPATVILAGTYNVAALSVSATNAIDLNNVTATTTAGETFFAPEIVLQAGDTTLTDSSSSAGISFNGAVDNCGGALTCTSGAGPFGFTVTENGTGSVLFLNDVGAVNPLASLLVNDVSGTIIVTGTTSITGGMIKTTGAQTYNGLVAIDNQVNPSNFTFWSTNPANITFENTLASNANANPVNITIDGNFVLANPNGNLNTSLGGPFINSFHVTGSSTFSSTALFHGVVTDGNQTYDGPVFLSGLNVNTELSTQTAGGVITFNSTVESLSGHSGLTIDLLTPTSILNFNGAVGPGSNFLGFLTVRGSSSATTNINTSQINTAGTQNYKGPVVLGSSTVLDSAFGSGGAIIFQSTVTGNAHDLTLISPSGSTDAVQLKGNITGLNSLTVGANTTNLATEADISTSAISATSFEMYFGPVLMKNIASLNLTSGTVTFDNTVNSATTSTALTITGNLVVGTSGSIGLQFASPGNVHVASVLVTGSTLGLNSNTSGDQIYTGPVTLNTDETMISISGNIIFESTVDGAFNLVVSAAGGGGTVGFGGPVGSIDPLASLLVTAGNITDINTTSISTTGTQTYNGVVEAENPTNPTAVDFSGTTITFNGGFTTGPASGTNPLDITITGNLVLGLPTGGFNEFSGITVNSLTVTGTSQFYSPEAVVTMGDQNYHGAVTLFNNWTFSTRGGGAITFYSTLDGNFIAHVTLLLAGSSLNFDDIVGGANPLSSLIIIGSPLATTNINTTQINTTGAQSYGEKVVLGSDTVLTSTSAGINFSSAVDSDGTARALTLDAFSPTVLTGNIGNISILKSLEIINEADINTGIINTTTSQLYDGIVKLGANTALTTTGASGFITFGSTIDNNFDLTVTSDQVRFKGDVGGITPIGALNVNAHVINFDGAISQVKSSGIQSYTYTGISANPLMTIGLDPVFTAPSFVIGVPVVILADTTYTSTAGNIDFQFTVDGPANLILNPAGSAIFEGDVGATTSLNNLIINGPLSISGATVINTADNQTYNGLVTLNNDVAMNAGTMASPCVAAGDCEVNFTLGTIGSAGVSGPTHNLTIVTWDAANGSSGAGIQGTLDVLGFTMGGSGGGNVSPALADYSTVGGATAVGAWTNTIVSPHIANTLYCVNGNCVSGSGILTINANNDSKTYGQIITPNSSFDALNKITVTGIATGDQVTNIDLASAGYPQTATVLGGPYPITASNASGPGISLNHYINIVYNTVPGEVTVNAAPLTITANNTSKTYGQTVTFAGTEFFTTGTLFNGDNVTSVTLMSPGTPANASVLGSPYNITPSVAVGTGLSNYNITYDTTGLLTVNPAPLTITSTSQTKNYGDNLSSTTTSFISTPLQNGETISTVDILSAGLPPTASVLGSPYAITAVSNAVGASGFDPNNYDITYTPAGNITVNPAPLTITSVSQTKLFGTDLSPITPIFTTTGLQNGETIANVTITSLGLPPPAAVGAYAITDVANATGGSFDPTNYNITYVPAGNIFVVSSLMPAIPNNVVQVQIFEPPVFPVCGPNGCDNLVIDSFLPPVTTEYLNNINYCDEAGCNTPEIFNQVTTGEIACFMDYREILDSKFYRVHVTRDPRTKEPCWVCEKYPESIKKANNIKIINKPDAVPSHKVMDSKKSDLKDTSKIFEKHWWHYPLSDHDLFMR